MYGVMLHESLNVLWILVHVCEEKVQISAWLTSIPNFLCTLTACGCKSCKEERPFLMQGEKVVSTLQSLALSLAERK